MKRFNSNTVRCSTHLVTPDIRNKAHAKREYKKAIEAVNFTTAKRVERAEKLTALPRKEGHVPRAFGRRTVGLSEAKRAMVERRQSDRKAFFAELGVEV